MSDMILKENKEISNEDMLKSLMESQTIMNYAFAGFKTETEQKFNEVDNKLQEHDEIIKRKIYLSSNKARLLRKAVKEKVKIVCEENNLDYHQMKSKIFPRVYGKLNDQYGVATYRELPEYFWDDILENLDNMEIKVKDLVNQVA
mgnify:FL=1|jgi:hypothetical protein|nr:MAG TPA: hypothetical protein [Caudoviricetes sp.]